MIIPMKKILLLTLREDREATVDRIAELGVMHVVSEKLADSADRQETQKLLAAQSRAILMLQSRKVKPAEKPVVTDAAQLLNTTLSLLAEKDRTTKTLDEAEKAVDKLKLWGDFDAGTIAELKDKGIFVYLCECASGEFSRYEEMDNVVVQRVNESDGRVAFVVIAHEYLENDAVPAVILPSVTYSQALATVENSRTSLAQIEQKLDLAARDLPVLLNARDFSNGVLEIQTARDGMGHYQEVCALTGYIPADRSEELIQEAHKQGWALSLTDPGEEDRVPTLIKLPRWAKIVKPLFDFLAIAPGYHELDVSGAVLFFFTIYFAMIVGDAGYGMILLIGTLFGMVKCRQKPAAQLPLRLLVLLSSATIIWGVLTNNYFGMSLGFMSCYQLNLLCDPETKDANLQAFCFLLAFAQMALGHLWLMVVDFKVKNVLSNLGWLMFMAANGILALKMIAYPGDFPMIMYVFYVIGFFLIMIFGVNWKDAGQIFNMPFTFISSFVDILSYIRLFAVGMAGFYIASSFNLIATNASSGIGELIPGVGPIVGFIVAVIVLLIGHSLNIALCLMGVLVHGVRLNTLEFANHVNLSWAGFNFVPLKKMKNNTQEIN